MRIKIALLCVLLAFSTTAMLLTTNPSLRVSVDAALESDMPVVFVDPPNVVADVGDTFVINVKVFNLSGDFYPTAEAWSEGDPLPPLAATDWRYNYSLGHLYALDLRLSWDPTILEYVSHTAMVPDDDHPGGILNGPDVIMVTDTADKDAGTYTLSASSQAPAAAFNAPDANATAFTMTFTVKKAGKCDITITNVDLVVDLVGLGYPFSVPSEAPHWTRHGTFRTEAVWTHIDSVRAGALVSGSFYDPVIEGEDVSINVTMKNDNDTITDTYNLSLYEGTTLLNKWENEELAPAESGIFNYPIGGLGAGQYTITANATILHETRTETNELIDSFTVVGTPGLQINGPSFATGGRKVNFSALGSVHNDPNGYITTWTWTLWAPGESVARAIKTGVSVSFTLPEQAELGDWTIMLVVKDNYDITTRQLEGATLTPTSELLRPATEPYREVVSLEVLEPLVVSVLSPENKSYLIDDVPLVFTVNKVVPWMGYSLDGQANVTVNGNSTLANLSHGSHSIRVFAEDAAGTENGSETIHFSVMDTTPPTLSVSSPENKTYDTTEIQLTFSVNEPVQWMAYSLNGQANVTILTSNTLLSGLSPGTHHVRVFAEDLHGNTGSSETIRFTVRTQTFPLEIAAAIVAVAVVAAAGSAYLIKTKRGRKPENAPDSQA